MADPARYYPFSSGRYEISPGLMKFGKDLGNGPADQQVFQIDNDFPRYRESKLAVRREDFERYICEARLAPEVRESVTAFMVKRFAKDHPGRELRFSDETVTPPYRDPLDAIACQIQEDFAIISSNPAGDHWLSYLHLCSPNHWAAQEKIGRHFAHVHAPVAGIEPINRRADVHVRTMIAAEEGLVRFAWGLGTDDVLNHHPSRDAGTAARTFDPKHPRAFVRVERQTIWGFPAVGAALFMIRTYFVDCAELKRSNLPMREALISAIESMPQSSIVYKGLEHWYRPLLTWLRMDQ